MIPSIGNVILGVVDLDAATEGLTDLGLDVLEGGRHERRIGQITEIESGA